MKYKIKKINLTKLKKYIDDSLKIELKHKTKKNE